jgi:hypothetical protein
MTLPLRFWALTFACVGLISSLGAQPDDLTAAQFTPYDQPLVSTCILGSGPTLPAAPDVPLVTQRKGRLEFRGFLFPHARAAEAFQFMWDYSFEVQVTKTGKTRRVPVREVAAWITDEGILVQPWNGALVDEDGSVIVGYVANHVDLRSSAGKAYNNFLPVDLRKLTVDFEGRRLKILAQIHTHPLILPVNLASRDQDRTTTGLLGIPVFAIENTSIVDTYGNYQGSINRPKLKWLFRQRQN